MILERITYWCEFVFCEKQMAPLYLWHTTTATLISYDGAVGLTWIFCKLMPIILIVHVSAEMKPNCITRQKELRV